MGNDMDGRDTGVLDKALTHTVEIPYFISQNYGGFHVIPFCAESTLRLRGGVSRA